jgi:hypothetical protein
MRRLKLAMFSLIILLAAVLLQNATPSRLPQGAAGRPPNQKTQGSEQQANTKERGTDDAPFVIKMLTAPQAQGEANTNAQNRPNNPSQPWSTSDWIAVIASVVAFFQFVALVVTIIVMRGTAKRQLRAYVLQDQSGIVDGTLMEPQQMDKVNVPGVGLIFKNFGQTPGYDVISWAGIEVIPIANEHTLILPQLQQAYSNVLGPGNTFVKLFWFPRGPLTNEEIAGIRAGTTGIYLHGRIEYRDAFNKRHWSIFRLSFTGQWPPPKNALFSFAQSGNDADKN